MALIQWSEGLSVGVAEIDRQHQKLIDMINQLDDAMRQGKGKDIQKPIIMGLIGYAGTHFKAEESLFTKFGYPDTEAHLKEHRAFTQKVSTFKDGFESGKLGLSIEIMKFLSDWLRAHIQSVDKQYTAFFHEKGLR